MRAASWEPGHPPSDHKRVRLDPKEAAKQVRQQLGGYLGDQVSQLVTAASGCRAHSCRRRRLTTPPGMHPLPPPLSLASQKAAQKRQEEKAAKAAKEAAGMRKLSSFFKPKPKA